VTFRRRGIAVSRRDRARNGVDRRKNAEKLLPLAAKSGAMQIRIGRFVWQFSFCRGDGRRVGAADAARFTAKARRAQRRGRVGAVRVMGRSCTVVRRMW